MLIRKLKGKDNYIKITFRGNATDINHNKLYSYISVCSYYNSSALICLIYKDTGQSCRQSVPKLESFGKCFLFTFEEKIYYNNVLYYPHRTILKSKPFVFASDKAKVKFFDQYQLVACLLNYWFIK